MILLSNASRVSSEVLATKSVSRRPIDISRDICLTFYKKELRALAKQENKIFAGSTSSLTGMLSHIYFLLSEHKEVDVTVMSQHFRTLVCLYYLLFLVIDFIQFCLVPEVYSRADDTSNCVVKL